MALILTEDTWLSRILERTAFHVAFPPGEALVDASDLQTLKRHAEGRRNALYDSKIGCRFVASVAALTEAGFQLVDTHITLEREADPQSPDSDSSYAVEEVSPRDHDDVLAMAGSCFRYSRFHLDPRIPHETADRVKREWIASYLSRARGEALLVAKKSGRPLGFLAVLKSVAGDRTAAVIDLIGVAPQEQGHGIGRALIESFLRGWRGRCDVFRVGTQAANIPSLKLYERMGFSVAASEYVLHKHVL